MVYNNDIPKPNDSPGALSQAQMRENFAQLETHYTVDHEPFTTVGALVGKHKKATLVDLSGDPITAAGEGAVYTNTVGTRIEPFYRYPSSGDITQLNWIKAWVRFDASGGIGAAVINDSYNVSGVTVAGGSIMTINFTTNLGNTNYGVLITTNTSTSPRVENGTLAVDSVVVRLGANSPVATVIIIGS